MNTSIGITFPVSATMLSSSLSHTHILSAFAYEILNLDNNANQTAEMGTMQKCENEDEDEDAGTVKYEGKKTSQNTQQKWNNVYFLVSVTRFIIYICV